MNSWLHLLENKNSLLFWVNEIMKSLIQKNSDSFRLNEWGNSTAALWLKLSWNRQPRVSLITGLTNSDVSHNQLVKKCHIKENRKSKAGRRKLTQTLLGQKHMINKDTHPSIFCGDWWFNLQGKKQEEGTFRIKQNQDSIINSGVHKLKTANRKGQQVGACCFPYDESCDADNQTESNSLQ